jgi:hypothetical protein
MDLYLLLRWDPKTVVETQVLVLLHILLLVHGIVLSFSFIVTIQQSSVLLARIVDDMVLSIHFQVDLHHRTNGLLLTRTA